MYIILLCYREILRHTQRLANPVWYRLSRQSLLRLRQRFPEKFQVCLLLYNISICRNNFHILYRIFFFFFLLQDTCLFSDVAARLSSGTYRMPARRFLQELFLDSPFDAVSSTTRTFVINSRDRMILMTSASASALFYSR